MLQYIADFLGVNVNRLDSDVGIMMSMVIFSILLFATFRGIIIWLRRMFGGS